MDVTGWLLLCWINAFKCERCKSPADSHMAAHRKGSVFLGPSAVLSLSGVKIHGLMGQPCLVTVARLCLTQKSQLSFNWNIPDHLSAVTVAHNGPVVNGSVHAFLLSTFSNWFSHQAKQSRRSAKWANGDYSQPSIGALVELWSWCFYKLEMSVDEGMPNVLSEGYVK